MIHRFSVRYLETAVNWHFIHFLETAGFENGVPPRFSKVAVSSGIGETNKWSDSRYLQKPLKTAVLYIAVQRVFLLKFFSRVGH